MNDVVTGREVCLLLYDQGILEYDEETVREAIGRELRRGGQVYYVYNRVTDIDEIAQRYDG